MERHEGKSIITYFLNFLCLIYEDGKVDDLIKEGIRGEKKRKRKKVPNMVMCLYLYILM